MTLVVRAGAGHGEFHIETMKLVRLWGAQCQGPQRPEREDGLSGPSEDVGVARS